MNAFIMVREGSVRIPDKNIKPFADSSLLQHKIEVLNDCHEIDNILVTSDCEKSLDIAKDLGCLTDKRPKHLCSAETKPKDLYRYISCLEMMLESEKMLSASVCYPLIKSETYDKMIRYYNENYLEDRSSINYISSFVGCHSIKENLWERKPKEGYKAINYVPGRQPASQDLPDIVSIAFGSIITSCETLGDGDLVGEFPEFFDLPKYECMDVDEEEDFKVAEQLYYTFVGRTPRMTEEVEAYHE